MTSHCVLLPLHYMHSLGFSYRRSSGLALKIKCKKRQYLLCALKISLQLLWLLKPPKFSLEFV